MIEKTIKIEVLSLSQQSWIENSLTNLRRIVQENVEFHQRRVQQISTTDLMSSHAKANGVKYYRIADEKFTHDCQAQLGIVAKSAINHFGLYKHQKEAILEITNTDEHYSLVDMATGCGKTIVKLALSLVALSIEGARQVFIVTPTQQLVQQIFDDLIGYREKVDTKIDPCQIIKVSAQMQDLCVELLQKNKTLDNKKVVMIFCQTNFLRYINQDVTINPQLILLDECHKLTASNLKSIQNKYGQTKYDDTKIVGFSATPPKNEALHYQYSRLDAVRDNVIAPYILNKRPESYLKEVVQQKMLTLCNDLQKHLHPNGQTLNKLKGVIYLPSIADVERIKLDLASLGIPIYTAHSRTKECQLQIKRFSEEKNAAITLAVGKLRIGFSVSDLYYAIILRAARNAADVKQMAGRVMRSLEGKIGYVWAFNDINTSELKTICDKLALERCTKSYLQQSGREIDLPSSKILHQYTQSIQSLMVVKEPPVEAPAGVSRPSFG